MNIDIEMAVRIGSLLVMALSLGLNVFFYLRTADRKALADLRHDQRTADAELNGALRALRTEIHAERARDGEMHTRVSVLETKMAHVPTHADLQGIRQEMRSLNEAVAAIGERSETTQEMVQTIQQYLLTEGKGGARR
jgi:hypothetical protein